MIPDSDPMSTSNEVRLIPSAYMMSNSACLKGGATLFFTTFTRTCDPMTSSFSFTGPNSPDVETERSVELERLPPSSSRDCRTSRQSSREAG